MTTGECCHLPGSLCDCSGSPSFSKIVEATGLGPPQYVAQVTSRDGRLLSTVIRALDGPRMPGTNPKLTWLCPEVLISSTSWGWFPEEGLLPCERGVCLGS
uniref:Membrane associated ring-CH-type finger 2 n=1 Tax=Equus asinus TaxID=9793 RepID=A0A9L0JPV3_EQUAS